MTPLAIRPLQHEEPPWNLLLLADPSRSQVSKYLHQGRCFLAYTNQTLVGALILVETEPGIVEIANIAVAPQFQGQGIGRELIKTAKEIAKEWDAQLLNVGTGNSSFGPLAFYQKCGFRIVGVQRDFFTQNYDGEIVENGIQCVDMIRLSLDLNP